MMFVIAGNHDQAYNYINRKLEERILKGDIVSKIDDYKYVHNPTILRGIRNPHGVFVGTWKDREDILEILEILITSSDFNQTLIDIKTELWKNATNQQVKTVAVNKMQQEIDNQILQKYLKFTS